MNAIRMITTMAAVMLLCVSGWAAKKGKLASPPPTKSSVAAESKAVSKWQTAVQRTTTATQESPTTQAKTPATSSIPDLEPALDNPVTAPAEVQDAAAFEIPWQSVNGGGGPMASANYSVNSSVGQASIGYSSSASYQAGVGYWYGVNATTGCVCPFQCDYDTDGFLTALDLGSLIDVLFAGKPEETDPGCSTSRGDFDCDGFPTALDLGGLIDHLFAGGAEPCDPCIL